MKTQLLEDIGQSTTVSLAPSKIVANSNADTQVRNLAPAGKAQPVRPRADLGVWRQKPAAEPLISPTQQPDQRPATLELQNVFEEIAALEAQLVDPTQQREPAIAPVEPPHALATPAAAPRQEAPTPPAKFLPEPPDPPAKPVHKPAVPQAEATLAPHTTQDATVPQDPLFDFTAPLPAQQAADPFTRAPTGLTQSRKRYLLWAACVLSGALLIQGGRWLYQERNDAGSLALIANEAREKPQVDNAVKGAIAPRELTPGPDSDPSVTPTVPASRPVSTVPPLVMLEPEPSTVAKVEQSSPLVADRVEQQMAPKPEPVAKQAPAAALPKPPSRTAEKQTDAPAKRATEKAKREPVRQVARASAAEAERPAKRDTTMTATLQACREHGYNAVQCVKRACEVTQYGFVCRGR
ncbi:hypothetical protein [Massilia niabensis]|uniref:Uncharacterized protein n=1 Tax=Massilia niabensis TaxID=544910 RepID=A0ABW0L5Y2_9BURK